MDSWTATSSGVPCLEESARAGIKALGVFAHDDKVDVGGTLVLQGAVHVGVEFDRTQVDVLVQFKAGSEENTLFQDPGSNVRMANGAQVDGVEAAQLFKGGVRQGFAGSEVSFAAEVESRGFKVETAFPCDRVDAFQAFHHNFRTRAVTGDDCDLVGQRLPPMC